MPPLLDDDGADKERRGCDPAPRAGIVIRCEATQILVYRQADS
jgi:hypothetical protein